MSSELELQNLSVNFSTPRGNLQALRSVSFSLQSGESLGLVGESGSGKSVTSLAMMGLLASNAQVNSGTLRFAGQSFDLRNLPTPPPGLGLIFQDPMGALNPAFRIGEQMAEALRGRGLDRARIRERCLESLAQVGVPDAEARLAVYPHQLSGGLAQRVMIAMALIREPRVLIADEPTTALDVTIQAQILSLLRRLQKERNLSLVLISHDFGVIAQNCAKVAVMYAGEVVESGASALLIKEPRHPYTKALLACLPSRAFKGASRLVLPSIPGQVPDLARRPPGCQFRERCPEAVSACEQEVPWREDRDRGFRCVKGSP